MIRPAILAPVLLVVLSGHAVAFDQPPIQGPQHKAGGDVGASKVSDTPDPPGRGVYAIGKQIYFACMQRADAGSTGVDRTTKVARRVRPAG